MSGKAKFEIVAEDKTAAAWKSAVGNAQKSADKINHLFEAAFVGISVAGIAELSKKAFEVGDQLAKGAVKAGMTGEAFTGLSYAAKLADVDVTGLSTAIKKMQVALSEAATGNKQTKGALDALGISISQIQRLKPEDQFELLADRINSLKDPADKARAATDLFGKAGADLLPLFAQGAAGIEQARNEAEKLGVVFNDEQLHKLSEAEDSIKRLGAAWQGFYLMMAEKVAPSVTHVLDALAGTRESELRQQIAFLDKVKGEGFVSVNPLGSAGAYKDIGTGIFSAEEGDALRERLQAQLENIETSKNNLGGRGRSGVVPGYGASDAAMKAQADAAKVEKIYEKQAQSIAEFAEQVSGETSEIIDKQMEKETDDFADTEAKKYELSQEFAEKQKQLEEDVAVWREQQVSKTAEFFKDTFLQAFDDWINTGKFKFGELLRYMAAEFARTQIAKMFESSNSNGDNSSGGGWLSALGTAIGSYFGGGSSTDSIDGKASGGAVFGGRTYLVGERGPELLRMGGGGGNITPNKALGGRSVTIHQTNTFAGSGNSDDTMRMLKESNRQLVDTLRREHLLVET